MFNHLLTSIRSWISPLLRTIQTLIQLMTTWILRQLFRIRLYSHRTQAGFVLPTTILLLLVVTLAVGTISLRTYQRTQNVIGAREQQIVYNIATPALDRARAKFEYLFRGDPRFPSGIPSEDAMHDLLLDGSDLLPGVPDVYVLDDETPLDLNEDGSEDAAWSYRTDTDGDGTTDATVAYSIILQTPQDGDPYPMMDASDGALAGRADALQVRNAPLSGSRQLVDACQLNDVDIPLEQGWFRDESSSAVLRKNLQVDVYVQPDDPTVTLATLEFQQDRQLDQGNKWGAWFRSDIDLSPGPPFNWNGAMHTEGNLMVARTGGGNRKFTGYLVSAPNSCIFTPDASEITVANTDADPDHGIPEFRGQVIASKGYSTTFGDDESIFHLHDIPVITSGDDKVLLSKGKDSVNDSAGYGPADFSIDPLRLATEGISQSRDANIDYVSTYDESTWEDNPIHQESRIYAESEDPPYLDDFFRADDRFGPKPRYGDVALPPSKTIGDEITGNLLSDQGLSDLALTREDAPSDDASGVGLDGYWERRACQGGLRLIVGQRLELGNAFGWGGLDQTGQRRDSEDEPMLSWAGCEGSNNTGRCNEARHRLTLRDNLAAVQATAVYHASAATPDDDTPAACLATTVHPGTADTLRNSATFEDIPTDLKDFWSGTWFANKPFVSNFFVGKGTNGWEYEVHPDAALNGNSDPTIQALQNLAYYAGDPKGGAPSFPPIQDDVVHPYPDMAMWGDFSVLRRIFDELWVGGYNSLSTADKSTLRSAACTVGMLAYNIGYLDNMDYNKDAANKLPRLIDAINNSGLPTDAPPDQIIESLTGENKILATLIMVKEQLDRDRLYGFQEGFQSNGSADPITDDFQSNSFSGGQNWSNSWVRSTTPGEGGGTWDISIVTDLGDRSLRLKDDGVKVQRSTDISAMTSPTLEFEYRRRYLDSSYDSVAIEVSTDGTSFTEIGRIRGDGPGTTDSNYLSFSADLSGYVSATTTIRFTTSNSLGNSDYVYIDNLKITDAIPYASNDCKDWPKQSNTRGLERLCTNYPKYPIVNALFPFSDHDEMAKVDAAPMSTRDGAIPAYLQTANANTAIQYRTINLTQSSTLEAIALEPKPLNDWVLPHGSPNSSTPNPNSNEDLTIACFAAVCGSGTTTKVVEVPFKDTALMNSREKMAVRVLNMNMDLLRTRGDNLAGDYWLPNSGLIYAFREDAVREDEIVRPSRVNWSSCSVNGMYEVNSSCRMAIDANAYDSTDPPLNADNLISPKAVDYYPDPDRRPHGFRLINGQNINRGSNPRGMSLISDNPVYIQGDFNLHQRNGCNGSDGCRLEEFTTKLNDETFSNFYTRNTLEDRFARPDQDLWRPAEILTDAVTILSDNFCDGSYIDGWFTAGEGVGIKLTDGDEGIRPSRDYGCTGGSGSGDRTSFLNFMRPNATTIPRTAWHHENPFDPDSPIMVSNHGDPLFLSGGTVTAYGDGVNDYFEPDDFSGVDNSLAAAISEKDTRVNAVMISGIVPMRSNQGYGGLHNFPRFISQWASSSFGSQRSLNIAGAFFQLNYSNYATGPFDQDAFETSQDASVNTFIPYYYPPKRLWGYDVGLQYAKAGAIAQRFVAASAVRSEFYSEPAADDPYMVNLCRAMVNEAGEDPDTLCASS